VFAIQSSTLPWKW